MRLWIVAGCVEFWAMFYRMNVAMSSVESVMCNMGELFCASGVLGLGCGKCVGPM